MEGVGVVRDFNYSYKKCFFPKYFALIIKKNTYESYSIVDF